MQYYLFLDESGDHGLKRVNPNFPLLVLCGILISAGNYQLLRNRINQLKHNVFGTDSVIFHSTEIRKKVNDFYILNDSAKSLEYVGESHFVRSLDSLQHELTIG